jgi:hypothetical protein
MLTGPRDIAEEGMVFDILGIVGKDNVTGGSSVAYTACTEGAITEYPVVLPVFLCREAVGTLVEKAPNEIDGVVRYLQQGYAIQVRSGISLLAWEVQPVFVILVFS